jgi:hypothetical protein
VADVRELSEQLGALSRALEEQERIDLEKDQVIERLTEEIHRLKGNQSQGSLEEVKAKSFAFEKGRKSSCESSPDWKTGLVGSKMINAAAQTDSPSVSRNKRIPKFPMSAKTNLKLCVSISGFYSIFFARFRDPGIPEPQVLRMF